MTTETEALVARYRRDGSLPDLPAGPFIDGAFRSSVADGRLPVFDPGRAAVFHEVAAGDGEDVARAVEAARRAGRAWGDLKPARRGAVLAAAAALIRAEADRLAVVEALDVGKPLQEAEGDVAGAARTFDYYAGAAGTLQGDSFPLGPDHLGYSLLEPVGVTAHVIPWNYPLSTAARGIAPALAAGCSVVAKPAEQTPLSALLLADILHRAGLPAGVCNVVTGTGPAAGAPLVAHPDVRHVTFTGSVPTGVGVMRAAAANVTSVLLELGGKSPVIVMADADLDAAVAGIVGAIYENAGQICSAGSRLLVQRSVADAVVERVAARARALVLGHGLSRPDLGPLNSSAHRDKVAAAVDGARARGVEVVTGGRPAVDPATGLGWFYEPTILAGAAPDDPAVQEEIFGPVLTVSVFDDEDEALALANSTPYGLVAGVYTADFGIAHRLARGLEAGQVYLNEYFAGGIEVPFGGTRRSGFGREKGLEALRSYSRVKAVAARIAR